MPRLVATFSPCRNVACRWRLRALVLTIVAEGGDPRPGGRRMTETIGWIGIGSMGHRMSRHLAAAGYELVMADASSTERAPPGARIAGSNAEVAALADTIVLSVPDG